MPSRPLRLSLFTAAVVLVGLSPSSTRPRSSTSTSSPSKPASSPPRATLAKLPVRFEANAGQFASDIRFVARHGAANLALRDDGTTLVLTSDRDHRIVVGFAPDGARAVQPEASEPLVAKTNYLLGNDPAKWQRGVPNFAKITYPKVLDGVDLVYHGERGALEYDFVVAPGVSVDRVAMNVTGAEDVSLTDTGELRIRTSTGELIQPPPLVYQEAPGGERRTIASRFRLVGPNKVGFLVASYDREQPLVIDPVIAFSTYLGGNGEDEARMMVADDTGVYVVGDTWQDSAFPTANAFQPVAPGGGGQSYDGFVAKLDPTGQTLLYATYVGGAADDFAYSIAIDPDGKAYFVGGTASSEFPTKNPVFAYNSGQEGFVTVLNAAGDDLVFSTLLSSSAPYDVTTGIAVDGTDVYVSGITAATDFSIPLDPAPVDGETSGYVFKLSLSTASVQWAHSFGPKVGVWELAFGGGALVAGGSTGTGAIDLPPGAQSIKPCQQFSYFLTKLDTATGAPIYSTCFTDKEVSNLVDLAVDGSGNAYALTDPNNADNTLVTNVVTKINTAGTEIVYATEVIAESDYSGGSLAVDPEGNVWVAGASHAITPLGTPQLQDGYNSSGVQGASDAVLARLDASGTLTYASFLGGGNWDYGRAVAVGGGRVYVGGSTSSADVPTTQPFQSAIAGTSNLFIAALAFAPIDLTPGSTTVEPNQQVQFTASGGEGSSGYTFSLKPSASGGTITPSGLYTAGPTDGTEDVVRVTDGLSAGSATMTVQIVQPPDGAVVGPDAGNVDPAPDAGETTSDDSSGCSCNTGHTDGKDLAGAGLVVAVAAVCRRRKRK